MKTAVFSISLGVISILFFQQDSVVKFIEWFLVIGGLFVLIGRMIQKVLVDK